MKNCDFIFILFFLLFTFYSCNKDSKCFSPVANGIVQKQGMTTYQYGTHVLTDTKGQTINALKSETINLDNYINKNVEVEGQKTNGVSGGPPLINVSCVQ